MGMSDIEIPYREICIGRLYGKLTWSICHTEWKQRKSKDVMATDFNQTPRRTIRTTWSSKSTYFMASAVRGKDKPNPAL